MLLFVVSAVAAVPLEVAVDAHARIDAAELAVRPDADVPVSALEDAARGVPHTGSALRDHGYSVWGVVVVDAPLEQVWAALGDEEVHPRYTATRWAAVVQGERCHSQRLVVMVRPTPVIADRWWVARMVETRPSGAVREVMWELLSDWTPPAELAERLEGAVRVRRGRGRLAPGVGRRADPPPVRRVGRSRVEGAGERPRRGRGARHLAHHGRAAGAGGGRGHAVPGVLR